MPPDPGNDLDKTTELISARDALERAARLDTPDEAGALLRQAQATGDTTLAAAITTRAHDQGWTDLVDYRDATEEQFRGALKQYGIHRPAWRTGN